MNKYFNKKIEELKNDLNFIYFDNIEINKNNIIINNLHIENMENRQYKINKIDININKNQIENIKNIEILEKSKKELFKITEKQASSTDGIKAYIKELKKEFLYFKNTTNFLIDFILLKK